MRPQHQPSAHGFAFAVASILLVAPALARAAEDAGPDTAVEPILPSLIASLADRFDIHSPEELKGQIQFNDPVPSDHDLWLASQLQDAPSQIDLARRLLAHDPNNLFAATTLAGLLHGAGDLDGALAVLERVDLNKAVVLDQRNQGRPGALEGFRCGLLAAKGRLDEAISWCEKATAKPASTGPGMLAWLMLMKGKPELAAENARLAISRYAYPEYHFELGLALDALGKADEARAQWHLTLSKQPDFTLAQWALDGTRKPAADWYKAFLAWHRRTGALELGHCGHYYLELAMPQRAERCFALSEKLWPGPGEAARLTHLAETDLHGAAEQAEALALRTHDPVSYAVAGWLRLDMHDLPRARGLFERALEADPRCVKAHVGFAELCRQTQDKACVELHTQATKPGGGPAPIRRPAPPDLRNQPPSPVSDLLGEGWFQAATGLIVVALALGLIWWRRRR